MAPGALVMLRYVLGVVIMAMALHSPTARAQDGVEFNGKQLPASTVGQLRAAGLLLTAGRFWYDPVSGWWGAIGGPAHGQLPPGLALGGALRADASGRGTGTFINGRELHPVEVRQFAMLFGNVPRLRFWMNAQGVGGPEGGPATFSLAAAAHARQTQPGGPALRRGPFGSTGGGGGCFYFNDPSTGASVTTGDC